MKRKEEIENMRKQVKLVKIDEESKVLWHKEDENRKERE